MKEWLNRQELLLGTENSEKLLNACVAVIGLGGVGGSCVEGLARAGIGRLILMDFDTVDDTNRNRQLLATVDTVGAQKTTVAANRVLAINPDCAVTELPFFYDEETSKELFALHPDYIIDCIDTVTAKLHLIESCKTQEIPLLTCLGTGNRLDPSAFRIGDIGETANGGGDGLARVMRRELRKRGITKHPVLYSTELPRKTVIASDGRYAPGSFSCCPPVAGFLLASKAIRDLIGEK